MRPRSPLATLLLLALFVTLALSGCVTDDGGQDNNTTAGDDDDPVDDVPPPAPETTLEVSAVGTHPVNPAFDPATLEAPAGSNITVVFTNDDTSPQSSHDWVLEGVDGASTDTIGTGETTNVTFEAPEPGAYTYFCSVPGHRDAGMEGTLTITGDNETADAGDASLTAW